MVSAQHPGPDWGSLAAPPLLLATTPLPFPSKGGLSQGHEKPPFLAVISTSSWPSPTEGGGRGGWLSLESLEWPTEHLNICPVEQGQLVKPRSDGQALELTVLSPRPPWGPRTGVGLGCFCGRKLDLKLWLRQAQRRTQKLGPRNLCEGKWNPLGHWHPLRFSVMSSKKSCLFFYPHICIALYSLDLVLLSVSQLILMGCIIYCLVLQMRGSMTCSGWHIQQVSGCQTWWNATKIFTWNECDICQLLSTDMVIIYVVRICLGVSVCVLYTFISLFSFGNTMCLFHRLLKILFVLIYLHLNIYNLVIEIRKYFGENIPWNIWILKQWEFVIWWNEMESLKY